MKKIVPLTVLVLVVLGFPVVARAGVDLVPDRSFGEDGFQRMELGGVATPEVNVDRVGRVLFADGYIARLRRDGRPDRGFVHGLYGEADWPRTGFNEIDTFSDIELGRRGIYISFVVTSRGSGRGYGAALLDHRGHRVESFGRRGSVLRGPNDRHTFTATALSVRRDNRIYVAGGMDRNSPRRKAGRLVRYLPDGRVDRSFARNGVFRMRPAVGKRGVPSRSESGVAEFTDVLPAADGGVFVSGVLESRFVMLKVRADGSLDRRFGGDGKVSIRTVRSDYVTMAGSWYMDGKISRSADGKRFLAVVQAPSAKGLRWRLVQFSRKGRVLWKRTTAIPGRLFTSKGERRHFYPSAVMATRGGEVVVTGSAAGSDSDGRSISDPVLMLAHRKGGLVRGFGKRGISILESAPLWDITDADYQPGFGVTLVGAEGRPWYGSPRAEVARFKLVDKSN